METVKTTNIAKVTQALKDQGIINPYAISGILAIISKESGFIPQRELPYTNTDNSRIREIFSITKNLTDAQLTLLKKDPVKFFNYVYGGRYGNAANEGYKYRGGGFNQLTFKDNYKYYGKLLKVDLVNDPDKINDPALAAKIVGLYMLKNFNDNKKIIVDRYGVNDINKINSVSKAVQIFYNANAGFGKDTSQIMTPGKQAALDRAPGIYTIVTNYIKSNPGEAGILTAGTLLFLYKILA